MLLLLPSSCSSWSSFFPSPCWRFPLLPPPAFTALFLRDVLWHHQRAKHVHSRQPSTLPHHPPVPTALGGCDA
eukprot:3049848-Pyramimonas_sp.AAC.1